MSPEPVERGAVCPGTSLRPALALYEESERFHDEPVQTSKQVASESSKAWADKIGNPKQK
jgi:hypothetical protein